MIRALQLIDDVHPGLWSFLIALVPTIASIVTWWLQRRPLREISTAATDAKQAATVAADAGAERGVQLAQVKSLVNGQREQLQRDLDHERAANLELAAEVARLRGGRRNGDTHPPEPPPSS